MTLLAHGAHHDRELGWFVKDRAVFTNTTDAAVWPLLQGVRWENYGDGEAIIRKSDHGEFL